MAVFKCKMCGGGLEVSENQSVATCEYCGTQQTLPKFDDERKISLFARANKLRFACEFDKAAGVYESIVEDYPEEAEGYWGLILCKYGIEYVDDPATDKKIPTCHRSSFDCLMDDSDFEMVMENSDPISRKLYREEAKVIEELRKSIVQVSSAEEPYDIFICYKETDEKGDRTIDSEIAQDVYTALTEKGYRVFFSRITLEDRLGQEYEPYIFAALNSAKVMLAFGTDYEYYNAVWVKNEWSRFLKLIAKGEKKTLIPCYKNIDAYDMPKEFAKLQAQNMGKVGAIQDLLRGVEKLLGKKEPTQAQESVVVNNGSKIEVAPLLKRAFMFLEDGDWNSATEYCEKVLDLDPENAHAYLGKLMVDVKVKKLSDLSNCVEPFDALLNYTKALRFGDNELKSILIGYVNHIKERNEQQKANLHKEFVRKREQSYKLSPLFSAGEYHTVGLKSNGTVIAVGENQKGQCNVNKWTDIVAVSAGAKHTIGLKRNGTVVATGSSKNGRCNISEWRDIVAISAGECHTVGLKSDGSVVSTKFIKSFWGQNTGQCNVDNWSNIIAVSASMFHTVGLKSDGSVVATNYWGPDVYNKGQCNVKNWTNIEAISTNTYSTVGLKSNGTVVAVGDNRDGQCNVNTWTDIIAVSAGLNHTVGLKSDGTVVATGANHCGQCKVRGWTDIVAISAGNLYTLGLKSDGTVVATGDTYHGKCNVSGWSLLNSPTNI